MMNKGFGNIMKQAQKMQEKLLELQEGLGERTVEATVGGGMVTVVANGRQEVVSIKIEQQVVDDLKNNELELRSERRFEQGARARATGDVQAHRRSTPARTFLRAGSNRKREASCSRRDQ